MPGTTPVEPALSGKPAHPSLATFLLSDPGILILCVLARILLQIPTNGQYGFHQDELITLDAAKHLDWGYVAYPPATPFIARIALFLFGPSLIGLRFFAVLAEGFVMLLTGLMIRVQGGSRWAQLLGAFAVATTPNSIIQGGLFQYETLDYLFWVLLAFTVMCLLKSENPRWWLAIGTVMGLGMQIKYTIAFLIAGVVVGCLVTRNRRYLTSPWLWVGAGLSLLIWLPNLLWQVQNNWITLDFLGSIHSRDMAAGKGSTFVFDQLKFNFNPVMLFLVSAGLYYFFFTPAGQRYRMIGWMYVVPFVLYVVLQANSYYLAPAYPMLAAGGAVWWEKRLGRMVTVRRRFWGRTTWVIFALVAGFLVALLLPLAPLGSDWWNSLSQSNVELKAEVGWPELVQQVATTYNSLPPADKAKAAILAGSSGEIGSIALYGPAYGLPRPISGFNSFWQYGYGNPPPRTLIVLGFPTDFLANFQDCKLIAPITTPFNVQNEETTNHRAIYVCHDLREPWLDFWKNFQYFG